MSKNHDNYLNILKRFPTGVTVVTTLGQSNDDIGITISSFTSVSLEPPQILFCLSKKSKSLPALKMNHKFVVNLLSAYQTEISETFAKRSPLVWESLITQRDLITGCLLLTDALGHLMCSVATIYEGGDHIIVLGSVLNANLGADYLPLVRHHGEYQTTHLVSRSLNRLKNREKQICKNPLH